MRRPRELGATLVTFAALVASSGCRPYGARPESPAHGGAPWLEIGSPHFRVLSDLSTEDAEATARDLEQGLAALTEVAFAHPRDTVEKTTVVVFRERSELRAFAPDLVGGRYFRKLPNDLEPMPVMLTAEKFNDSTRAIFYHELTHDLFTRNFGWSPPWLSEGWAQYYSTLRVEDGRAILGSALADMGITDDNDFFVGRREDGTPEFAVPRGRIPSATTLIQMNAGTFYEPFRRDRASDADLEKGAALYVGSWALVHMMLDGGEPYTPRFRAFLKEVGSGELLDRAWKRAFDDLSGDRMDRDFREYVTRGQLALWETRYDSSTSPITLSRRIMSDAEVHLLWARLVPWNEPAADKKVRPDLDEAIARAPDLAEPHYWRGLYALARRDFRSAEEELAKALAKTPDDPRLYLALVVTRVSERKPGDSAASPELVEAIEQLGRVATSATQLRVVADAYHDLHRRDRGFELAKRAAALAPIDPLVLDTYAQFLFDEGKFEEALAVQRRAVASLPERMKLPRLFVHLQRYETRAASSR